MKLKGMLIFVFSLSLLGCKQDDPIVPNSTSAFSNVLKNGTWRVSYYLDDGQDETTNFTGFAFQFANDNVLNATKNNTVISGTWSMGIDDSIVKLLLNFSTPPDFESLSGDWKVSTYNSTQIQLTDSSGGNGTIDYLRFERN
jgi:hypothetical protein